MQSEPPQVSIQEGLASLASANSVPHAVPVPEEEEKEDDPMMEQDLWGSSSIPARPPMDPSKYHNEPPPERGRPLYRRAPSVKSVDLLSEQQELDRWHAQKAKWDSMHSATSSTQDRSSGLFLESPERLRQRSLSLDSQQSLSLQSDYRMSYRRAKQPSHNTVNPVPEHTPRPLRSILVCYNWNLAECFGGCRRDHVCATCHRPSHNLRSCPLQNT